MSDHIEQYVYLAKKDRYTEVRPAMVEQNLRFTGRVEFFKGRV